LYPPGQVLQIFRQMISAVSGYLAAATFAVYQILGRSRSTIVI
jgi:hypothetical protein